MNILRIIAAILLLAAVFTQLPAEETQGKDLDVRLIVIGQGDPVYSFWGHTGLAIRDNVKKTDIFFDFGNFYFEEDHFFRNFALGRLLYMAYAAYTQPYLQTVVKENRTIDEYDLNLPDDAKLKMYKALIWKSRPENRTYLYHHYNDNCSTRIRDYINDAVGGQLKEQTEKISRTTFRRSFLRFTSHKKLIGWGLSLLQGMPIDKKVTLWQEMFLPAVLEEVVRDFSYRDDGGNIIPLVSSSRVLNAAPERPAIPDRFPDPWFQAVSAGLLLAVLVFLTGMTARKGNRSLYALLNIISGLTIALLGTALLFLMTCTDHTYAYDNLNLFMLNPVAFFVIPVSIMYWRKGGQWLSRMHILWRIQLGSTALMILLKVFTPLAQDNLLQIVVFLPLLAALSISGGKITGEVP